MFWPYMWAIFRLRSNFAGATIQEFGVFFWVLEVGWGRRGKISFVSIVGTMGIGSITGGLSLVFFVHLSKWVFFSYAKGVLLLVTLVTI